MSGANGYFNFSLFSGRDDFWTQKCGCAASAGAHPSYMQCVRTVVFKNENMGEQSIPGRKAEVMIFFSEGKIRTIQDVDLCSILPPKRCWANTE